MAVGKPGYTEGEDSLFSGSNQSESQLNIVGGSGIPSVKNATGPIPPEILNAIGGDGELVPVTADGTTDNLPVFIAALGLTGTFQALGKPRARFDSVGLVKVSSIFDIHPSISVPNDGRGVTTILPGNNLPAVNAQGAQAAFVRVPRISPVSPGGHLAYSQIIRGLNLDATGTTQSNPCHGIRIPDPDPSENSFDPDPGWGAGGSNKDYVAGELHNGDIVAFPGSGGRFENGNGRLHLFSFRFLNNGTANVADMGHGAEMLGNDIVCSGHTAAGGNAGFGMKVGSASGFFAVTMNMWGKSATRSLTCGAMWMNQRKCFGVMTSEFNDWIRMTGGNSYWRGGHISLNNFAPFNDNFVSDGVAIDVTSGGPNTKLQAHIGLDDYWSANFIANQYQRTASTAGGAGGFGTWMNVGGDLTGAHGTAHQRFLDISGGMVNTIDTVSSAPNVRPWTGPQQAFTTPTANTITSNGHGLNVSDRVVLTTTGSLVSGLYTGITLWVIAVTTNTFQVSRLPGGAALTFSGAGTGTHTWGQLNTLPYQTHSSGQITYQLMDSFTGEIRLGALGGAHSKILLGMANSDFGDNTALTGAFTISGNTCTATAHGMEDGSPLTFDSAGTLPTLITKTAQYWAVNTTANTFQIATLPMGAAVSLAGASGGPHTFFSWYRTYKIEAGDRTQPAGLQYRNALHGNWECDSVLQYRDTGWDGRVPIDGGTRNIQPGHAYEILVVPGGGLSAYTLNLPTDMSASYELVVLFVNGAIGTVTWTTSPTSSAINTSTFKLPTSIPGPTAIRFFYRRDTNTWQVTNVEIGAWAGRLGRTDATAVETGLVGEIQRVFTPVTSEVPLTTAVPANIATETLTPGNYLVIATIGFDGNTAVGVTSIQWGLNTTSGAIPGTKDESYGTCQYTSPGSAFTGIFGVYTCYKKMLLSASTPLYLVAQAAFTSAPGTVGAYGTIQALRIG